MEVYMQEKQNSNDDKAKYANIVNCFHFQISKDLSA